jgi:hypothetical protein
MQGQALHMKITGKREASPLNGKSEGCGSVNGPFQPPEEGPKSNPGGEQSGSDKEDTE